MESDCQFVMPLYDDGEFSRQLAEEMAAGAAGGRGGGGGGERKRRFTEEQVRSLETTFHERRAKLEPREKAELARELGLQPRQVAIWFQNKRARWRTKQIEQDFAALRAQYDALLARVDSLKHEKLALAAQLDELRGRLNERQDVSGSSCDGAAAEGDDKRNSVGCFLAVPAVDVSEEQCSAAAGYEYAGHIAYSDGLSEPFCNTPELWETSWPTVESWNAVA